MRKEKNPWHMGKALVRMSWHPANLFNLWQRTYGPLANESKFQKTSLTLFQQKWRSRRFARGYHGDWIQEGRFKRDFLPDMLPRIVGHGHHAVAETTAEKEGAKGGGTGGGVSEAGKWKARASEREARQLRDGTMVRGRGAGAGAAGSRMSEDDVRVPIGSLMFMEVERRLDVLVFRACFAPSAYEARRLVTQGHVKVNGQKHTDPNTRLNPGDIFQVDPDQITMLQSSRPKPSPPPTEESTSEESTSEAAASSTPASEHPTSPASTAVRQKKKPYPFILPPYASPFLFIPPYIEVSFAACSAVYVRHPTAKPGVSEIPTPWEADGEVMRLTWEYYVSRRPRTATRKAERHLGKYRDTYNDFHVKGSILDRERDGIGSPG